MFFKSKYAKIIVGLGNPESKYDNTRHNIGFRAVDNIARDFNCSIDKKKFNAMVTDATVGGERVLLMKPLTYMNNSGIAVSEAMRFYKLTPDKLIVLCDDVSFDIGQMRIKKNGSDGGHNGLKSIEQHVGSAEYLRIKIGVGKRPAEYDLADWVLSNFSKDENNELEEVLKSSVDAVKLIISGQTEKAMNLYNKKARK